MFPPPSIVVLAAMVFVPLHGIVEGTQLKVISPPLANAVVSCESLEQLEITESARALLVLLKSSNGNISAAKNHLILSARMSPNLLLGFASGHYSDFAIAETPVFYKKMTPSSDTLDNERHSRKLAIWIARWREK
jgi:hypothetical protein